MGKSDRELTGNMVTIKPFKPGCYGDTLGFRNKLHVGDIEIREVNAIEVYPENNPIEMEVVWFLTIDPEGDFKRYGSIDEPYLRYLDNPLRYSTWDKAKDTVRKGLFDLVYLNPGCNENDMEVLTNINRYLLEKVVKYYKGDNLSNLRSIISRTLKYSIVNELELYDFRIDKPTYPKPVNVLYEMGSKLTSKERAEYTRYANSAESNKLIKDIIDFGVHNAIAYEHKLRFINTPVILRNMYGISIKLTDYKVREKMRNTTKDLLKMENESRPLKMDISVHLYERFLKAGPDRSYSELAKVLATSKTTIVKMKNAFDNFDKVGDAK
jgi:hypothetical protein